MKESKICVCQNCGQGCRDRHRKSGLAQALAMRPWIWVVLGYAAFIGALGAMVTIAVRHQQPDVLVPTHGR
jgi:hypothetical protein